MPSPVVGNEAVKEISQALLCGSCEFTAVFRPAAPAAQGNLSERFSSPIFKGDAPQSVEQQALPVIFMHNKVGDLAERKGNFTVDHSFMEGEEFE